MKLLEQEVKTCQKCNLSKSRINTVFGQIVKGSNLLLIGEAPGFHEDLLKEPFVGKSGDILNKKLNEFGFKRSEVSILNMVKCRPPENRDPRDNEINSCLPAIINLSLKVI